MSAIYEQRERGYNGWSNYETWRINLEMFSDYDAAEDLDYLPTRNPEEWREKAVELLAEQFAGFAHDMIEAEFERTTGIAYGLAMDFLNRVDFEEIADHFVGDYLSQRAYEQECAEKLATESAALPY